MNSSTDAWIKKIRVEMAAPSLNDNTADFDRLVRAAGKILGVEKVFIPFPVISSIPKTLREFGYKADVILYEDNGRWNLIDIIKPGGLDAIYALAIDLGSSTVVVRLLDLSNGRTVGESSFLNPQVEIGSDILARIHYANQPAGLEKLQELIVSSIRQETINMANKYQLDPKNIFGLAVAGNTTMTHFFLGLDPYWLCREPYIPVINKPELLLANELNMGISSFAPVMVFPNVGSYFGGDLIAGIIASGMNSREDISILVDVGTNAEVVLGNKDWLMACAGAAGPALEGGVASMGMMAGPGVIDQVRIDPHTKEIHFRTIENKPPIGICGSGLIDLVAQLFLAGLIDLRGKFVRDNCGDRLLEKDGITQFVVVEPEKSGTGEPLTLSQPDIDSLIRSKAAMYTILTTITNTVNISFNEISHFYIAGTFGSYIDPRSAITIGMIPDLPLDTYVPLGNTSLKGATMALISKRARDEAFRVRDQITYLELNVNQEFMNLFSAAKFIPHTDKSLFPSVKVYQGTEGG